MAKAVVDGMKITAVEGTEKTGDKLKISIINKTPYDLVLNQSSLNNPLISARFSKADDSEGSALGTGRGTSHRALPEKLMETGNIVNISNGQTYQYQIETGKILEMAKQIIPKNAKSGVDTLRVQLLFEQLIIQVNGEFKKDVFNTSVYSKDFTISKLK